MKFLVSILISHILQIFFIRATCQDREAAPVIIKKGKFQLAYPVWIQSELNKKEYHLELSLPLPPWSKIYQFCPPPTVTDNAVSTLPLQLIKVYRDSQPALICEKLPSVAVVKVLNIEKFKKYCSPEIEWYVIGYKINSRVITDGLKISNQIFDSGFRYESVNEDETIVSGYSVFYNKNIKQVVTAQYKLLPSEMYSEDPINFTPQSYNKVQVFDLKKIDKTFENNMFAWVYKDTKPEDIQFCEQLIRIPLISPPHFIYWFHKRMAWLNINVIPIWYKYIEAHRKINKFLETVAQRVGKLKITSGVAGIGTTEEGQNQRAFINFNNDSKIIVSDFVWKSIEFKHTKEIYGIILIQVNTLSEPNYRICEEDVCSKYKWSIRSRGEENIVYCCNMTAIALNMLEVPFLDLKERKEFDLTRWGFGRDEEEEEEDYTD